MMKPQRLFSALLLTLALPVSGQILPQDPLPQVLPRVTQPLQRAVQGVPQPSAQQMAQQLAAKAALPDPLTTLPKTLDVRSATGQLRWREVEVEQGFRAVEREWLLFVSAGEWQQLVARWPSLAGYQQSHRTLDALGMLLITVKVPPELDSQAQLRQQFNAELAAIAGRNHLYQPQANTVAAAEAEAEAEAEASTTVPSAMCTQPVTLGMVDTAIALDHPALTRQAGKLEIVQKNFLPDDIAQSYGHGTAVAGVLAAQQGSLAPLLPQLTLYSASAFYASNAYQQSATLAHILSALNWLVSQQVNVINMSLTGPDNPVLAATVAQLARQNIMLIGAAGNGGPAAKPLYPAAYPQVLAVTAVDQQAQLYRWANQGPYIDFAALGVRVTTLTAAGGTLAQSGTSIAAPQITAAVACLRALAPNSSIVQIKQQLTQQARDLGEPGKDHQFGYGLLSAPLKVQL
jgi:minor extracellular protease Epr